MAPRIPEPASPDRKPRSPVHGGGIHKARAKPSALKLGKIVAAVSGPLSPGPASPASTRVQEKAFRFLDLPGELRNRIYNITLEKTQQSFLAHLPRISTLRARKPHKDPKRQSRRPYHGLTQVCRQIRWEYRPLYMRKQEIGLDLAQVNRYLTDFYPFSPSMPINREDGRTGNMTVALPHRISPAEKDKHGINVWPMLNIWANSTRLEAGFGRHGYTGYDSHRDGEAKDMYRLFCHIVLPNRKCSPINTFWRQILHDKKLAEVRLHRAPAAPEVPYMHILFKPEHRESWMVGEVSQPPSDWLSRHGIGDMEHFAVKVGVLRSTSSSKE